MHDHEKPGRGAQDRVEEASGESFPASDPPAWTAARAGKPESPASKEARQGEDASPPRHCELTGLFRSAAEARPAADALLSEGFNLVDLGPPQRHGNLGAGIGARAESRGSLGVCAAFGALAAGAAAALLLPRGARNVMLAAAGGAVGAASAHAAAAMMERQADSSWPPNAVLLRVTLKSPDDQKRAVAILEAQGARKLHVSWPQQF